jgi:GDP-L-fucose synthase
MKSVLVTGANGMLGKAVIEKFDSTSLNVIKVTRSDVDLRNFSDTLDYFSKFKTDLIVHCAAMVGGIQANILGGNSFFLENVLLDHSVLQAARQLKIRNLIYIGSSCMYPANLDWPLKEGELLSGKLEPTNESYALAKIFGSTLTKSIAIQDNLSWRVFIGSNLYGPHDHFDSSKSHLVANIISKIINAKEKNHLEIEMWGDGSPKREFTYVSDLADWIVDSRNRLSELPLVLNTGAGEEYSVREYYDKVASVLKWDGIIKENIEMPNGNHRKLLDSTLAKNNGWSPKISFDIGLKKTIDWYLTNRKLA